MADNVFKFCCKSLVWKGWVIVSIFVILLIAAM